MEQYMKSIPGAITVLAGAGLLATMSFISPDFAPVILVVGLILCALGLLAPGGAMTIDPGQAHSLRFIGLRFSIRDLLWLAVVWWRWQLLGGSITSR
jgi:hypothetical protein